MSRPHVEFIHVGDVAAERLAAGSFAGTERRLLSEDSDDGSSTALHAVPAGWSGALGDDGRPYELFVLDGELRLAGQSLGAGSYAYAAAPEAAWPIAAERPSRVLVMAEPVAGAPSAEPVQAVDTTTMRWAGASIAAVPPGLVIKPLRDDPETGDRTWLAAVAPGWMEERAEVHPTVEESLMLRGDMLLGTRGAMRPGCYFWRPPMVPHGPMYTRTGGEFFFRTKGGTLEVDYQVVPEWDALVAAYRGDELYPW